jgi:hypothetical protein
MLERARVLARVGAFAACAWFSCAEGQDVNGDQRDAAAGGSVGTGGASGTGGRGGGAQGGNAQGGNAQGGNAQGGNAQGGSAQGGSAQGGSAQGGQDGSAGSSQGGTSRLADAATDVAVGSGGAVPRDASGDTGREGATPLPDATADRGAVDAPVVDAREAAIADASAERSIEASADGALCSAGATCSQCAEQRCPAVACSLCQDQNHVSCAAGCTAILDCVIQNDGCATNADPICFSQCSAVINAQPGGSAPRDGVSALIRCSCF